MHITLKFLGGLRREELPYYLEEGKCLLELPSFSFNLEGVRTFTHEGQDSVIWAGVSNSGPLEKINEKLNTRLASKAEIAYIPHLTLGRVKDPLQYSADGVASFFNWHGPIWKAEEAVLFKRYGKKNRPPNGCVYEAIQRYPFGQ